MGVASRSRAATSYLEVERRKRVHLLTVQLHFIPAVERRGPTLIFRTDSVFFADDPQLFHFVKRAFSFCLSLNNKFLILTFYIDR